MVELVICGASLPGVCVGVEPPEEIREQINRVFVCQLEGGYRVLPRIEDQGTDDEVDNAEDGTFRRIPDAYRIHMYEYRIDGAIYCMACYTTLCMLSPSGAGLNHELLAAVDKARSMDPDELPAVGRPRGR